MAWGGLDEYKEGTYVHTTSPPQAIMPWTDDGCFERRVDNQKIVIIFRSTVISHSKKGLLQKCGCYNTEKE